MCESVQSTRVVNRGDTVDLTVQFHYCDMRGNRSSTPPVTAVRHRRSFDDTIRKGMDGFWWRKDPGDRNGSNDGRFERSGAATTGGTVDGPATSMPFFSPMLPDGRSGREGSGPAGPHEGSDRGLGGHMPVRPGLIALQHDACRAIGRGAPLSPPASLLMASPAEPAACLLAAPLDGTPISPPSRQGASDAASSPGDHPDQVAMLPNASDRRADTGMSSEFSHVRDDRPGA